MALAPERAHTDPTGYIGPLRFLEVMLGGKYHHGSGLWSEAHDLMVLVHDAAFVTKSPLKDSHGQIAHYARSFELYDKHDEERKAELLARLDEIPHLADFHIDIDMAGDLEGARRQALKLVEYYLGLGVPEAAIGIRFSGSKGFDVMVPWQVLGVQRQGVIGLNWNVYKRLAQALIDKLGLEGVDLALYRRNGTIRLENTLHPSSGLYKVRLTPQELRGDVESIRALAAAPRRPLYSKDDEEGARARAIVGLQSLYLVAQAQADAETMRARELRYVPLDVEVEGLTPCLNAIRESPPVKGTRNETLFHAAMMLKHIGRSLEEAEAFGREWLGTAYATEGGPSTTRSAYHGPFAGGCRWMREQGYAGPEDCRACPVGQRRYERDARVLPDEPPLFLEGLELPTLAEQREQLKRDLDDLDPHRITVIRFGAGGGKTHATLSRSTRLVEQGGRVLFFVKDTRAETSLAADLRNELREVHGYTGKVQVLYGRDEGNCDNWPEVEKVEKRGYSAGKVVCPTCMFRHTCDYYGQYEAVYEPGIYIAPHAMLPLMFDDERRGFSREFVYHDDDGKAVPIGGPLKLIVIDEDALDVLIERYWVGSYHLENEARHKNRWVKDALTGRKNRRVVLDDNWLQVVEWLQHAIRVPGPVMPALASVARAAGKNIRSVFMAIDESRIVDPDFNIHRGHKPFTERLYLALKRELPRLADGNYTIWAKTNGLEVLTMRPIAFPPHIPVVVLDAYANEDLYRRFYRAAGVNRLLTFRDYPVRERPNTTYVLGANLLAGDLDRAQNGHGPALAKVERILSALQVLTSDGVETYLVAKRSFFQSQVWQRWQDRLPYCVADGDAGMLYFWRGRGINAASGKRVAVLQVPNFHPDSVMQEASLLFADEPRLDDARVRVEDEIVWAPDAENPRAIKVDKTVYADERLNLVNERYRMDELVQMAFRSRSLTTGAEIIVFADLPDPRLPAKRVFTIDELLGDESARAAPARRVVYDVLAELGELTLDNLMALGIVGGKASPTPLRRRVRDACPDEFRIARDYPVDPMTAKRELIER